MLKIERFTFNPLQENTYVLYEEKDACCLLDPGCYFPEEVGQLDHWFRENHLVPHQLLNTHCHLDHMFGNDWAARKFDLQLEFGEHEQWTFDRAEEAGVKWGMPFKNYVGPIIYLAEGDKISVGTNLLEVLFTPGHSAGHVVFYNAAQGFLMAGDVLFRGSIGRTDLPGGNHETLMRSIREKLLVLPDSTIVYPGHGEPTTIGFEKENNPFLQD